MSIYMSSASSAKDIDEALKAKARHAKRDRILQPRKPIHLTRYGLFIAGLFVGAVIAALIAFVMSVSGTFAGVALAIGTVLMLGVIGVNIGHTEHG